MTNNGMRYDAFISYSHAADGELAPALQRALQRLAKPWYRRRSLEVFRDQTGLAVDPYLWGAIVRALDDAEWFLLLTSPQAAQSEWVNKEIEHWKANRPLDRMLPVLTDGNWEWDSDAGGFTADSNAVPAALHGVFTDEPRHLDLRWARNEDQLTLRNSRFRDAVAEVAAPLHGKSKDQIEGEDVRQHRRTLRVAWSAVVLLAILAVAAVTGAGIAVRNADRAEQRRIEADAGRLAAQSQSELNRPDLAFLLAANGFRRHQSVQTRSALLTSVANLPEVKERLQPGTNVTAVAMSDAADRVWLGTADGEVIASRFSDGQELARSSGVFGREIVAMYPARSGSDSVVATDGATVTTLDPMLNAHVERMVPDSVHSLAVEQTTGRVAAGTSAGDVVVWAPDSTEPTTVFPAVPANASPFAWVTALAWTPDGALIVAGADGLLRRFAADGAPRPVWVQDRATVPGAWVSAMTVTVDGTVVTGATNGTIKFWNAQDGTMTAEFDNAHIAEVRGVVFTGDRPEAGSVASVGEDGFIVYWDHRAGIPLGEPMAPIRADEQAATAVAWDPANPLHGVTGGTAGGAMLLDYGADRRRPIAHRLSGWDDAVAVAMSPDGDRLAAVRDRTAPDAIRSSTELVITSPDDPDPAARSVAIDAGVEQLTFSPDGSLVMAGTDDGRVAVWDGDADRPSFTAVAPGEVVGQLAIAPDGKTVATGSLSDAVSAAPATVRLWRVDGTRLVQTGEIEAPPFSFGLTFTPDGSRLIIGGLGELRIHSLSGGPRSTVDLDGDSTRSLAVSPDGSTAVVGLSSGPVRLLDVATGEQRGDDLRVAAGVTDLAFRDDGAGLVTVSQDGSFIVWDLASRRRLSDEPLTAAVRTSGIPVGLSLGLHGDRAVTAAAADPGLVTWSLDPEDWIDEGCRVHQRNLTDSEKNRFNLTDAAPVCPD
jgi:WD40 repeat protein